MATKVRVPLFDANITEGVLNSWRKRVGDSVERGEPLVDLVTDKANFEIESPANGTLLQIVAGDKSTIPAGYIIAAIGDANESAPDVSEENNAILAEHLKKTAVTQTPAASTAGQAAKDVTERVRATPKARKMARDLGVDIEDVSKAAPGARVTEKDVEEFARNRRPE